MEQVKDLLRKTELSSIIKMIFHSPNKGARFRKIICRPIIIKSELVIQFEQFTDKQVFHKNVLKEEFVEASIECFSDFKKVSLQTNKADFDIFATNSSYKIVKNNRNETNIVQDLSHNKTKQYLIPENTVVAPLIDLGVFTKEGKVVKAMYDKYRQINRFLELVNDATKGFGGRKINIVDFGCGKSYLTFVLYYFLKEICEYDISVVGLDLKQEVIDNCNLIAKRYKYDDLKFITGDIKDYLPSGDVDLVITLHACDTATDYALYNAIKWNAKAILSVPCCQHEINKQITTKTFSLLTKYGIVKERISALITDTIRANLLEICDYEVQILEFVDLSHSPKNLLIRAIKKGNSEKVKTEAKMQIDALINEYNLSPTLCKLLEYNHIV